MTALRPEQDAGGHEYDPLTDPLPPGGHGSPWFRAENNMASAEPEPEPEPEFAAVQQEQWYEPIPEPEFVAVPEPVSEPISVPVPAPVGVRDDETVALRKAEPPKAPAPTGGRAERRKAARGRGKRPEAAPAPSTAPLSRMEARRAARAAKDSPAVVASRAIGEIFITLGVLMLLFVTYQLWWTNVRAHQEANQATHSLQDDWSKGKKAAAFEPGQGFAILHIPTLDVVVPIAEGVSKSKVLDKGMVGHYDSGSLKTAMPSAKTGNFALAGHRNTHGEPFRYINHLKKGDKVVVETQDDYYTYEISSSLPQTSPSNTSVIMPIPTGSGFTKPGRYISLTTCTPEFTSTYRMIVWGKMVDERPRSKGVPSWLPGG
ncbi:class E sortase [Streptomyces sp. NBC_01465]|uniref:class E sortase n=1 Tax=Streptomyces sp. NBC_01465 TaxID=2903878 RepID=UPI002E2F295D|nr:class E sortase [Streptomyces sp. NBC_01465]